MGLTVVGLGLFGVGAMVLLFAGGGDVNSFSIVTGFGLGASSIALFARVGGGIYTKAADVGADLVGKVEAGIDRKSTRLNSSHVKISYAVFCLKKKKKTKY